MVSSPEMFHLAVQECTVCRAFQLFNGAPGSAATCPCCQSQSWRFATWVELPTAPSAVGDSS
jgi:hypothetical protein